ncbi:helix-turn-helix domain-containing protein [Escherichia coli]|uniref:helix-turn-helix domain-containing protein n=1 Tax=Escherichia coli TaxID=562 RepID=UPI000C7FB3E0|nr:helix-turn-helix domain-containing protein [Escherichia coli]ELH6528357.1 helix-turn-helix domain-containing protein [Escherichia coli]ELH6590466.1 helix-turn-helix domain-containing protein [Escherichia coli]KAE9713412.1 helix-turn-helix domain-containing protein [Escherichia coli]KAE9830142.1 helix-turn-helix domain-containing protein [Escherichia coli]MBS9573880.1 helix-turn-helix domain-containing protein [Escherichia coli]
MNGFPQLMTGKEVAELFRVSQRTITRWVDKIPGFPIPVSPEGTPLRFIRSEVLEYFYRGRQQ